MCKDNTTLVSFCLPVFNVEKYVQECIDSILAQGIENFEILCVDDGSTDGSYAVLLEMQKNIPSLRVYKNEQNRGVSYTRNRLIQAAQGRYIWFVDPDDILYPNSANKIVDIACKTNAEVCLGNYQRFDEDEVVECPPLGKITWQIVDDIEHSDYRPVDLNGVRMCAIWAGVFKSSFLKENKLRFTEGVIVSEDTLFYYEWQLKCKCVVKCDFVGYLYRQRKTSVVHSRTSERNMRYYYSTQKMMEIFQGHLETGEYKDKSLLENWIYDMKGNIAFHLAVVDNSHFVSKQLKELKQKKLYPYMPNCKVFARQESFIRRLCRFLLPLEPVFWTVHILIAKLKLVKY